MPKKIIYTKEIINRILELYDSGIGTTNIGKELNIPSRNVIKILKSNYIELRGSRKYHPNEDFFEKIDTEEKAYWLGFLYADGCVRKRKRNSELKLKLAIKDLEHVEKFKQILNADIKRMAIQDRKTHFYIQWYGINNMDKIYELFYEKSNLYLNRKNNKFKKIKEEYGIRIK